MLKIRARVVTVDRLDDDWAWRNLRFRKRDLLQLIRELNIPVLFRLDNGGVHSGEKAFILFLRRMAYPGRLTDLEHEFGISYSTISRLFNAIISKPTIPTYLLS